MVRVVCGDDLLELTHSVADALSLRDVGQAAKLCRDIAGVFLVVAVVACAGPQGAEAQVRVFDSPADVVAVGVGQVFDLRLASNRTTGYMWFMAGKPDPKILSARSNRYEPPDTTRIGAGGYEVFRFAAVGAGQTEASMFYSRTESVGPAGAAQRVTWNVVVRR